MRAIEQEAIAAFLNTFEQSEHRSKTLVLDSATTTTENAIVRPRPDAATISKMMPLASKGVIEDFLRVAAVRSELDIPSRLVRKELRWQIADKRTLDRIFQSKSLAEAWRQFYKEYPDSAGLFSFSRVGVDEESNQALFYFSQIPGGLGGVGFMLLLHKRFGVWRIQASENVWVS